MLKSDWKKIGKRILFFVPLIAGTAGYLTSGEKITDALYAGMTLYGFNSVSSDYNIYIEFARWTAPIAAGAVIVSAFRGLWNTLHWRVRLFGRKDSVAVYSDEDIKIKFDKKTKAIYPGEEFKGYAKSHIILLSSDQKSLQFYQKNKEALAGKKVYIGLRELNEGLISEIKNIHFFDCNSAIARLLWKKIAVWELHEKELDIVIYGSSRLAKEILAKGLQLNLYALDQKLRYHFITDDPLFQVRYQDMPLMNKDEIHYYKTCDPQIWDKIKKADLVIAAEKMDLDLLQTIAVKAGSNRIYYHSPKEGDAAEYISMKEMVPFGRETEIFTDENIRQQGLIRDAITLNGSYIENENKKNEKTDAVDYQKEWDQLSPFFKASNISSADFGEVIRKLLNTVPKEELAQMEHIRWCRFYYLNDWKYGVPSNGQRRDMKARIHKDLMPYDNLPDAEKEKDIDNVQQFISG